ncbi:sugar phosphate isomerase/epimerase family protein [Alicyclobacillus vulcanalis]|nr:sugar phosphate isomerase/epimerase [Alicyclobacillus vulcanalis]
MLKDDGYLNYVLETLHRAGIRICALNCSGNPLDPGERGARHREITDMTFELAGRIEVDKIVMMSGLPAARQGDLMPNWICYTVSWPEELKGALDYQWNEVAIPYWRTLVRKAEEVGVQRIALENFSAQLVYNSETLLRLRSAVGPRVGMNLDPSHLMWMGADPICAVQELGDAVFHVHAKDTRFESAAAQVNGALETKPVELVTARSWNYVAVGLGRGIDWWKSFIYALKTSGYDDFISIEVEDFVLGQRAGLQASLSVLEQCLFAEE